MNYMKGKDTKNITNEQLAELMQEKFLENKQVSELINERVNGIDVKLNDLKKVTDELYEGAFTKDEKEEVLNMVRNIDERLEEETLGKDKITLTRGEYDGVADTVGFENRFEKIK
jgi:hypothetical protein